MAHLRNNSTDVAQESNSRPHVVAHLLSTEVNLQKVDNCLSLFQKDICRPADHRHINCTVATKRFRSMLEFRHIFTPGIRRIPFQTVTHLDDLYVGIKSGRQTKMQNPVQSGSKQKHDVSLEESSSQQQEHLQMV